MSTRAVIGRTTGSEGEFAGVYSHWDGYPTALGRSLFQMLHGHFHHDLAAMLKTVIDVHPAGWSILVDRDWKKKPGYPKDPRSDAPASYCHETRHDKPQDFTHEDLKEDHAGLQVLYILD